MQLLLYRYITKPQQQQFELSIIPTPYYLLAQPVEKSTLQKRDTKKQEMLDYSKSIQRCIWDLSGFSRIIMKEFSILFSQMKSHCW